MSKKGITHLHSSSAGGQDLSNDTQIKVIGLTQLEIRTKKRLRNLSEKPAVLLRYTLHIPFHH